MSSAELAKLNTLVLSLSFFLSVILGALMQRTHFCTMGAISDGVLMGDWTRMRQWVLAMAVAILGFALLVATGQLNPAQTPYGGSRWLWLSTLVGGLLFGVGMVIASGCGARSLVRLGGGNLKSLVVLLVMGLSALATLRGITAVLRVNSVDLWFWDATVPATLPQLFVKWFEAPVIPMTLLLAGVTALALWGWISRDRSFRLGVQGLAGLGVGLAVVAMWWVSASLGHVIEHPETLAEMYLATNSGRAESLSFVGPVAYALDWLLFFSDKNKVLTLGIASVAGVVLGSWGAARMTRTFRWEGFANVADLGHHLLGAVLMGIGGVTAVGCTIGQGISGVSNLSLGSLSALASMALGAVLGLRYQNWRLDCA